jgi:16S rRNA (adenine1518-N6/adenine1519-N6)-dimethyltransferase
LNLSLNYDSPVSIKAFLQKRALCPQKKFGQNFLVSKWAREKLVASLDLQNSETDIWEIGAGIGAMTAELLGRGARVTAFEIDRGFCAVLNELFADNGNFSLVEGSVLETWKGQGRAEFLLANLPYNIAARVLGDFIENAVFFKRMAVTVQREAALRMKAKPSSADYSSFSVLCSSVYDIKSIAVLKGECFYPVPNVDSEALRLELKSADCRRNYTPDFYRMVRALFAARRKTIKNNLSTFIKSRYGLQAETLCRDVLESAGIPQNERAENLSCEDFVRISAAFEKLTGGSIVKT